MDFPEKGWSIFAVDGFPLGWFKKLLSQKYEKNGLISFENKTRQISE